MHNKVYGRKLSRNVNSRKALFKSLITELLVRGSIKTTTAKAKSITGDVDGLMRKIANDSLANRKAVAAQLSMSREEVTKLFSNLKTQATARMSGYTTVLSLPPRRGDQAKMTQISLLSVKTEEAKDSSEKTEKSDSRGQLQTASK